MESELKTSEGPKGRLRGAQRRPPRLFKGFKTTFWKAFVPEKSALAPTETLDLSAWLARMPTRAPVAHL